MKGKILKASAGTGKTYRLSLEYLAALLRGESYKNILVMTFTKKATSEIKERILLFLTEMYNNRNSELYKNITELHSNVDTSEENIRNIYNEILSNSDNLMIFTIDGFINKIFKNVIAPSLNIFSYEVADDSKNKEILLRCFETIVEEKENFKHFSFFLENYIERDMENYLNIIKSLVESRWQISLIDKMAEIKKPYEVDENYINQIIKNIVIELENIKRIKASLDKKKVDKITSDYVTKDFKWLFEEENYITCIKERWETILKADKCWNGVSVKEEFMLEHNINLPEYFDELKKYIAKLIFNTEILVKEKEILKFIHKLYQIYDNIKITTQSLSYDDISNYVYENIDKHYLNLFENGYVTKYFEEIFDGKFKTIFIDEFQDTSILQWKILNGIINSCEYLICVGDEKQSIYGWRGGEKALFESLPSILNVDEENMNVTYRSCENIVDITNTIFSNISNLYKEEMLSNGFNLNWNFVETIAKTSEKGYFELIENESENKKQNGIENENDEDGDYDSITKLIDSIENNFHNNYAGIGIIARTNKVLGQIANVLTERKIPFSLEMNTSIIENRVIVPIYKLIKFYVEKNIFSLLEFLRSDAVKIGNEEVKIIVENSEKILKYIFENEIDSKNINFSDNIYLIEILEKLKYFMKNLNSENNFILEILTHFNILETYSSENDLKNIYRFYELSQEYNSIYDFFYYITKEKDSSDLKQVSAENNSSITLLSIHKSKGLEFNTVYYYHSETKPPSKGVSKLCIDLKSPFIEIDNFLYLTKYLVSSQKKLIENLGEKYKYIIENNLKIQEEEINNIYVALTRAKKNLFLVLDKKSNKYLKSAINKLKENLTDNKIGTITFEKEIDIGKNEENEKSKKDNVHINLLENINFKLKKNKILSTDDTENKNISNENKINIEIEDKKQLGNAVHYYLEHILTNSDEEHLLARKNTISNYASLIDLEKLINIFESSNFKNFFLENDEIFSDKWDRVYIEYDIFIDSETRRIDRMLVKNPTSGSKGQILVIDYKTGGYEEEQVKHYIEMIEEKLGSEMKNYVIEGRYLEVKI